MPKRKSDKFYQEWHIIRTPTTVNVSQEFTIEVPRPLQNPSVGSYWAIEIHTIEYYTENTYPAVGATVVDAAMQWALTTSARTGKTPFITGPSDCDNLWFNKKHWRLPTAALFSGMLYTEHSRLQNTAIYTDNTGHGKLIVGDKIFLQYASTAMGTVPKCELSIEYTWTTVSCAEYVEELTAQLEES